MWTTLAWTYVQDRATKMMGARPGAWLRNWRKWLQNKSLTHNTARITITRIHVIVGGIQRHYITKRRNCYVTKSPLTHRRRFLRNHKTTQRCVTRGRYFERVSSYVTFVCIRWLWTTSMKIMSAVRIGECSLDAREEIWPCLSKKDRMGYLL